MKNMFRSTFDIKAGRRVIRAGSIAWFFVVCAGLLLAALLLLYGLRAALCVAAVFDAGDADRQQLSGDAVTGCCMDAVRAGDGSGMVTGAGMVPASVCAACVPAISVPAISIPAISIPAISIPAISIPAISIPAISSICIPV